MATLRIRSQAGDEYEIDDDGNIKASAPKGFVEKGGAGPGSRDPDDQTPDLHVSTLQGLREHTTTTPEQRARKLDADATASHTDDPGVQAIAGGVMAAGAGGVAGPLLARALPAAPKAAQLVQGAVEGATASKVQGGDATTGAVLGAIPGAASALGEATGKVAAGADNRIASRALDKLEERTTKRTRAGIQTEPVEDLVREHPEIAKAAGNDTKLAAKIDAVKGKAIGDLDRIYMSAAPEVDHAAPLYNMDTKIAELRASKLPSARKTADALQGIRDDLADTLGTTPTSPKELRAIQSDYQQTAYGKAMPGDQAASINIAAHEEAQKAVGDAVFQHVTGLDRKGAIAAAEENPDGLAAQLLKANSTVNGANRLAKGIADRESRVQPKHGVIGKLLDVAKEIKHSPSGFALSKVPQAAAGALGLADRGLARMGKGAADLGTAVPNGGDLPALARSALPALGARRAGPDAILLPLVVAADAGDPGAQQKLAELSRAPIVAARIDALRRKRAPMEARP